MTKQLKTVRRTVVVVVDDPEDVAVASRALEWESAGKTNNRKVYRVERATPAAHQDQDENVYLIDMELTCRGANRHDFSKFVERYIPEAEFHYITD